MFTVPIEADGTYHVRGGFSLDPASGSISMRLDDGEAAAYDLYRPHRTLLRSFGFEPGALTAGNHTLTLRYEGEAGNEVGIDYIWVQQRK